LTCSSSETVHLCAATHIVAIIQSIFWHFCAFFPRDPPVHKCFFSFRDLFSFFLDHKPCLVQLCVFCSHRDITHAIDLIVWFYYIHSCVGFCFSIWHNSLTELICVLFSAHTMHPDYSLTRMLSGTKFSSASSEQAKMHQLSTKYHSTGISRCSCAAFMSDSCKVSFLTFVANGRQAMLRVPSSRHAHYDSSLHRPKNP